jgi:hypothetical protein
MKNQKHPMSYTNFPTKTKHHKLKSKMHEFNFSTSYPTFFAIAKHVQVAKESGR